MYTRPFVALVVAVSLCACAGTGTSVATRPTLSAVDAQRIAAIEQVAQERGIEVVWVNPPKKRRLPNDTY